jgi:hypothetical protein
VKGWIAVDLDATLAHYEEWVDIGHVGKPVERMVARVREWLREGKDVRIFTARVYRELIAQSPSEKIEATIVRDAIEKWCLEHLGQVLPITCVKDMHMIELWDDRAVSVEPNTGRACQAERPRSIDINGPLPKMCYAEVR